MPDNPLVTLGRLLGGVVLMQGNLGHQVLGQLLVANTHEVALAAAFVVYAGTTGEKNTVAQLALRTVAPALAVRALIDKEAKRVERTEARVAARERKLKQRRVLTIRNRLLANRNRELRRELALATAPVGSPLGSSPPGMPSSGAPLPMSPPVVPAALPPVTAPPSSGATSPPSSAVTSPPSSGLASPPSLSLVMPLPPGTSVGPLPVPPEVLPGAVAPSSRVRRTPHARKTPEASAEPPARGGTARPRTRGATEPPRRAKKR